MKRTTLQKAVIDYCVQLGCDPLLVQGAGGNVSCKEGDTLWVKASGQHLAEAAQRTIFVPVNLPTLQTALAQGDFAVKPTLQSSSALRPSIETLLHALLPQTIVVHLHAVDVLAHLVREQAEADSASLLADRVPWIMVDYHKPGAALASAVYHALRRVPTAQVVLLRNHGLVLAGDSVEELDRLLDTLLVLMRSAPRAPLHLSLSASSFSLDNGTHYDPIADRGVQQLALDPVLFDRLQRDWALYPDHVVFLGAQPTIYSSVSACKAAYVDSVPDSVPALVFIKDKGVFATAAFNAAQQAQLRCYYDVLARQDKTTLLQTLAQQQIAELLNWDAERYRIAITK